MIKKAVMIASVMILSFGVAFANPISETTQVENQAFAMITGSVINSNTGEAVANATVELTGTEKTATTDEYGTFVFEDVKTGTYTLSIEADGYQDKEKSVNVNENGANIEVEINPEM